MFFLKYLIISVASLLLFSCTSTSIEQRYNKQTAKLDTLNTTPRFSSDNDELLLKNEFDIEPIEDNPVDVNKFLEKSTNQYSTSMELSERDKVMIEIVKYLNTPYHYGGSDNFGIDCSAFTKNVFLESLNYNLPRTANQQFNEGEKILNKNSLKFGDLVFFNTTKSSYPGHVGIYIGEDLFAHASFSQGVTVSSMESDYFKKRYIGATRNVQIME
ncbi:MAG: C40 family peptidase [Bacteroidetes bacterium]|nr:C40 family peptidase [Bacteroidota bacterium]MBU1116084.1 C40 family peptidase [Bacteroidota bacterium]MBU1799492.1 C40 family peptidase [Bacteroidota bacterium]